MEELDEFGIPIKKTAKPSASLDEFGIPIKKKDSSTGTVTPTKSVSVTPIGSSDGKGFPKIDTNSVAPGLGVQPKVTIAKKPAKVKQEPEKMGFGEAALNRLDTGLATFSKSVYDAPKMLLDAIYAPQNYIADKLNIPSLKVDPETYAFENIPSKTLDKKLADNNTKIQSYKTEIGGDVVSSFEKGDYGNAFKHAALNSIESAPLIAATFMTGGESLLANSIMIGSSASTQYDSLGKEHPEMSTNRKLANSAVNGALEVVVGKYMEGLSGNVWKTLLRDKGAKAATSIATNSFKKSLEKVVGDSPIVGVASEYAEERITDGLQQMNDIATGAKTEFDWNQNKTAGLSSLGFSLPNATALYGAKAYISNKSRLQVKSSNKEIMNLQNELQNPDLTPEKKQLITDNITKIYTDNKALLGTELEKLSTIQDVHKKELITIDKSMDQSKSDAIDIKHDSNISDETKISLLNKLKEDFKKNLDRKNEILTKTPFELLSGNEQAKRETQASREIMKKENPDGTKSIKIEPEEIQKLATETYNKELADKKISDEQTPETTEAQPQAEVQKPSEAEKVDGNYIFDGKEYIVKDGSISDIDGNLFPISFDGNSKYDNVVSKGKKVEPQEVSPVEDVVAPSGNKPIIYKVPALLPKKFNADSNNTLMTESELELLDAKAEKIIENPREDVSDRVRIQQGNAFTIQDLDAIEQFFKARREGKETRSFSEWRKNTTLEKNETTSSNNPPTDGNLPLGANNVGENGITKSETPIAESVPSAVDGGENKGVTEVSDLDHAKSQIDKGVLNWNGDTGAERVNLGITWADIRKGEKDIKAGKVDTVPAKRLIEALKTAKENGGYEYKQGSGGQIQKQFVSLEDIQRSNNEYELTDLEQKEVDDSEFESAMEYDKNFNSLSEQEQIEILENYENIQNDSGTPSADSGQLQSKNDVSSEKEGTGENSGAKEKIDNKDLESFRDKIKDIPESGVIAKYLSGDTIERVEGETPRNNQEIDTMKLSAAGNHGKETVAQAKELFGEQYVEKSLEFLDGNSLKAHEKAILYVSLENEMYNRRILDPENLGLQKLQDLVRKKSQQHLRESSLAINAGRLRAIMKDGYTSESVTDKLFSSEELSNKRKIEKAIQADADAINREAKRQENNPVDSDLEKLISSGVEKQINEIYKKLPTNRRVRADKAITALENIQSKLRGKAYDASIGIPIALIDSGITIIKNSIKAGVNIADAIEIGINHIKEKYGKDWDKEDDFRADMLDGFKDEGIEIKEPTVKQKTKQQEYKELVKQSLIEAGFGRDITVRTKDGKEQRQTLDWKKLAGEEGSLDKIKENVENSLKNKGYTESQISDIQKDLQEEYNNLRASIIEKSLNELNNRNTPRKPVNIKTSAKRLAELYNYGLFEKESDTYDHLMNSALGMNQLGQDSFMEAKRLAAKLSELFTQKDKEGNPISQSSLKHGERVINKQIEDLLSKVAWGDSDGAYKAMIVAKEFISLSQRNALVSVPQALENTTSGYISRFYNKIGFSLDNVDTKSLAKVRKTLSQMTFKDITLNGGLEFGDITSPFISKSKAQDFIVNASDSKFYHGLASAALGKAYLESADSMHKSALTEKFFQYNLIKVLRAKGYSKSEAINYVSEQLTGQTFDNAMITSKQIIDKINNGSDKKVIPDSKESIFRLAHDIVREALIQGKKMTIEEVEASFKSAETAAGFELGHEPNNVTSEGLKKLGSAIQIKIDRAVKEKDWTTATTQTGASIVVSNILNPFVGGGTNWALIALQKSGIPTLSTFYWNIKARGGLKDRFRFKALDVTSEQGIKNLEKTLKYQLLAKNTNTRLVVGATVSMAAFMLMKSTGADDDLYEWMKKHPWANKYLKKISPPVIQLMLAQKDKRVADAVAQQMNIKADSFDEGKKVLGVFKNISSGKVDKALGGAGQLLGSRLSMPIIPWRVARDVKGIYRGLAGLPEIKLDYKTSGFWNGYFQGGMLEQMGLRPRPSLVQNLPEDKFKESQRKIKEYNNLSESEKDKETANNQIVYLRGLLSTQENYRRSKINNTPYYVKKSKEPIDLSDIRVEDLDETIFEIKKVIEEKKILAGDRYKEPKE